MPLQCTTHECDPYMSDSFDECQRHRGSSGSTRDMNSMAKQPRVDWIHPLSVFCLGC